MQRCPKQITRISNEENDADRATPHTVTGQSPYETLFARKMRIGCISPEDQQHQLRNNKEYNIREFVDKKNKKTKEFYDVKQKVKKQDFHLGEEVLVKDKQVYHRRNHLMINVEIRNTESSSTAANQTTSVSDVRKRATKTTAGKSQKLLA